MDTDNDLAMFEEMVRLEQKLLMDTGTLTWLVSGQPVIALFHSGDQVNEGDKEHIGDPSPHNQVSDRLRLWIGINRQTNELLVMLTHQIKVSRSSRPRVYFVVLPSESLVLDIASPMFWTLTEDNVPDNIVDQPSDDRSAQTARLLQVTISMVKGPEIGRSTCIMPDQEFRGHLRWQSKLLLHKLKALSKASCFELFTNYNTWVQVGLKDAQNVLERPDISHTTPEIDLTALYPGGRDGAIDAWSIQGLSDNDKEDLVREQRKLTRRHEHTDTHERAARRPSKRLKKSSRPRSRELPPPYDAVHMPPDSSPTGVHRLRHCGRSVTTVELGIDNTATDLTAASLPRPDLPTYAATSASGPTVDSVFAEPQTPLLRAVKTHLVPDIQLYSIAQSPVQPQSTPDANHADDASDNSRVPETVFSPVDLEVPVQLTEKPVATKRYLTPAQEQDHPLSHISLDSRISLWLLHAWEICPYAHYLYITDLLHLGAAAQISDDEAFHTARVSSVYALLLYSVSEDRADHPHRDASQDSPSAHRVVLRNEKEALQRDIPALVSWLLILDPTADMKLFPLLKILTELKEQLLRAYNGDAHGEQERNRMQDQFYNLKATVMTQVVVGLGPRFLAERGADIAVVMLKEMDRVKTGCFPRRAQT